MEGLVADLRQTLLAVEPSPQFAARVRAATAAARRRRRALWPIGWIAAAGVAAGAAIWLVPRDAVEPHPVPATLRVGQDVALGPREGPLNLAANRDPVRTPVKRPEATAEPEIIVPADAARALRQYLELARNGTITEREPPAPAQPAAAWIELIDIPAIEVRGINQPVQDGPPRDAVERNGAL